MATNVQSTPLCRGPRPGFAYWSTEQLRTLLSSSSLSGSAIVVLTPDENRAALSQEMGFGSEVATLMLGIREAKGLDFAEVLIVDFFKNLRLLVHNNLHAAQRGPVSLRNRGARSGSAPNRACQMRGCDVKKYSPLLFFRLRSFGARRRH